MLYSGWKLVYAFSSYGRLLFSIGPNHFTYTSVDQDVVQRSMTCTNSHDVVLTETSALYWCGWLLAVSATVVKSAPDLMQPMLWSARSSGDLAPNYVIWCRLRPSWQRVSGLLHCTCRRLASNVDVSTIDPLLKNGGIFFEIFFVTRSRLLLVYKFVLFCYETAKLLSDDVTMNFFDILTSVVLPSWHQQTDSCQFKIESCTE